eukprot:Sspe_Gene.76352::Locus_47705_Transcript_1_1_Confidence_1.000_Length_2123::g.76352::m.76352/K01634/SGPL1, DPL1; sphinganine-1-phosphate aldolase
MDRTMDALLKPPSGERARQVEHAMAVAVAGYAVYRVLKWGKDASLAGMQKQALGWVLRSVPGANKLAEAAVKEELQKLEVAIHGDGDSDAITKLPAEGTGVDLILRRAQEAVKQHHAGFEEGRKWGGIYYRDDEVSRLHRSMWGMFSSTNALYPAVFPTVRKYEAEIISMVLSLVHGHEVGAVGLFASGGTESIMLAALSYREQARERGIAVPEMIAGLTCHPAIFKSCHYLGIKLVKVPVDENQKLRADQVRKAITRNTIAIFASAPTFSHGVVDPIEELGALAEEKGLGLHVDNCLGGFLLTFLSRAGHYTPKWDFEVRGVTSMSVDVHKYGFATKGASVVAFRDKAMRQRTYVTSTDGCEGLYTTPTIQGSRSGATVAVAWATLVYYGEEGYMKVARRLSDTMERFKAVVRKHPDIDLLVNPDASVVPIVAKDPKLNIYKVASMLEKRGWNMFTGQTPPVMCVCVGEQQTEKVVDEWAKDLKEVLEYLREHPEENSKVEGTAAVYGAAATTPVEVLESVMRGYNDVNLMVKPKASEP